MPRYDLSEPATLFEAVDPLDEQLQGQPIAHGPLREMIIVAGCWHDTRLRSARIVTAARVEYRARDILQMYAEVTEAD